MKQWAAPGIEQVVELEMGFLPRELVSEDELKGEWKSYRGRVRPTSVSVGLLNPAWVEPLMGFPVGWTEPAGPRPVDGPRRRGRRRASSPPG